MNNYNDYSQPLIVAKDFMNFLNLSKRIFPQQWELLAAILGINTRNDNVQEEYKESQIFIVLLNLQWVANFRSLKHYHSLMVWDNFQQGQELWEQLGGRSSKFLIRMVEVAHHVVPFLNFWWDDCNTFMQYDHHQAHPSPLGMQK